MSGRADSLGSAQSSTSGRVQLAPSDALRKWFDHVPERFGELGASYRDELAAHTERVEQLHRRAAKAPVTIVYAARDRAHNNAVVLAELIRDG